MIQAMIFDMDGTLVQTEQMKAVSYARALAELSGGAVAEADVQAAYADVVGRSREEVARALAERFGLASVARARLAEDGEREPWEVLVDVRLGYYDAMIADAADVRAHRWPTALALLDQARHNLCKVALATTSNRETTTTVLGALGLQDAFDVIATADDVRHTKPHPEAYRYVAVHLGILPRHCLAIEDSPAGIRAALAAGVPCVAVTTDYTRERVHEAGLLEPEWVVDDHGALAEVVQRRLDAESGAGG